MCSRGAELRIGVFFVQAPWRTEHRGWSDSRGRFQDTFVVLPRYPWSRHRTLALPRMRGPVPICSWLQHCPCNHRRDSAVKKKKERKNTVLIKLWFGALHMDIHTDMTQHSCSQTTSSNCNKERLLPSAWDLWTEEVLLEDSVCPHTS